MNIDKLTPEQKSNAMLIGSKAEEMGIDPNLALAFAWVENRWQTKGKSPKGAVGVMQVMPANAKPYGYAVEDLQDPNLNIDLGLKIFKDNLDLFDGNERAALVAYNAGPNVAKRYIAKGEIPTVIPDETKSYLESIHEIRPLVISEANAEEEFMFERPEAGEVTIDQSESGKKESTFDPITTGLQVGFGAGALEQLYNYNKNATDKKNVVKLEQELLKTRDPRFGTQPEFGSSGRARETGFNLETQRRAEQAAMNKENIERMRRSGIITGDSPILRTGPLTATDSGILVKPEALLKQEPPLTETQKLGRKVAEKIPGYRRFAPMVAKGFRGVSEGANRLLSKAPVATTTALGGLGVGLPLDIARERFQKGDIKGGLLSTGTGLTNLVSMAPTPLRGPAFLASIPLDIANAMYEPSDYTSVTKRFPPKN
jgi:hypothetical protein